MIDQNSDSSSDSAETPAPVSSEVPSGAPSVEAEVVAPVAPVEPPSWDNLGLIPEILDQIKSAGFATPTPVQSASIQDAINGLDLIVSAVTGSGKTAAFALPMIQKLKGREGTYGLVLAPTREIAQQTQVAFEKFGAPLGVRSICLIGGVDMRLDTIAIATYPQVIVATPGRLCDHLERGNIWLDFIEVVTLDEADKMLDMGFADQLNAILDQTPNTRQTLLFSATFAPPVERLAKKILYEPKRISIGKSVAASKSVDQWAIFCDEDRKLSELKNLLRAEKGSVFVFTRSKEGASRVYRTIHSGGFFDCVCLHSDLRQSDRERALERFKAGEARILIATDVVGRGIHVDGVALVINYDLPMDSSDYVHRIGRTGRAGEKGKAVSLITARDKRGLRAIEEILGRRLPTSPGQELLPPAPEGAEGRDQADESAEPRQHGGGRGRGPANGKSAQQGSAKGSPRKAQPQSAKKSSDGHRAQDGSGLLASERTAQAAPMAAPMSDRASDRTGDPTTSEATAKLVLPKPNSVTGVVPPPPGAAAFTRTPEDRKKRESERAQAFGSESDRDSGGESYTESNRDSNRSSNSDDSRSDESTHSRHRPSKGASKSRRESSDDRAPKKTLFPVD